MKLGTRLSKAYKILGYLRRRRKVKLYQQWVKMANLAPGAIPAGEVAEDIIPKIDKGQLRRHILYLLLGFSLGVLCTGLIFIIVRSC